MKQLIITFLIFTSVLSFSQEQDSVLKDSVINLTLDDAILKGIENNYQILISQKDLEISQNNNSWGKAGLLPTVTAGVSQMNSFTNSEELLVGGRTDAYRHSITPSLNAQMILFNGFAIKLNKENLERYEAMSETNLRMTIENTVSDIINAYYSVLLEYEKLAVSEELMNLSRDRYNYFLLKKELGVAVTYDVLQFKNNFLTDSSNYLLQLMNAKTAARELSKTLGDTAISDYKPTDDFLTVDTTFILSDLEHLMLQNNSSLQLQYMNEEVIANNIKMAKSSWYPSLSLSLGADHTNSAGGDWGDNMLYTYSYGVYANLNLSYTIFNGFNRKRNIANAKIEADKMRLQIDELEMVMRNNLFTIYRLFENRKQLLKVAEENYKAAKLNLDISKEKFDAGAINSFNYRDIQVSYLNTAYALLFSKYNLIITYNDLLRVTGQILSQVEDNKENIEGNQE